MSAAVTRSGDAIKSKLNSASAMVSNVNVATSD